MAIEVGQIVEGVVTGITNFGAFISLPGNVTGLVHISEVADAYVKDIKDYLKEQDKVKVKVINVDPKGKIGLSIKQAQSPKAAPVQAPRPQFQPQAAPKPFVRRDKPPVKANVPESFEDKLSRFIKESDQKQMEFKRSTDAKRGGRGAGRG